jgi:hypothetical protein
MVVHTILMEEVVGYTPLMQENEQQAKRNVVAHQVAARASWFAFKDRNKDLRSVAAGERP